VLAAALPVIYQVMEQPFKLGGSPMPPRTCLWSAFTLGILAVFASLPARAQGADEQALKAANAAFYAALSGRNEAAMGQAWAHAPHAECAHDSHAI
jgi:hypothetical protein